MLVTFFFSNLTGIFIPEAEWSFENVEKSLGTNFCGTLMVTNALLPLIEDSGKILFMGSFKARDFWDSLKDIEMRLRLKSSQDPEQLMAVMEDYILAVRK
jgi:hypothetical protein